MSNLAQNINPALEGQSKQEASQVKRIMFQINGNGEFESLAIIDELYAFNDEIDTDIPSKGTTNLHMVLSPIENKDLIKQVVDFCKDIVSGYEHKIGKQSSESSMID